MKTISGLKIKDLKIEILKSWNLGIVKEGGKK